MAQPTIRWTLPVVILLLASGCATPVGVKRLDEQAADRKLNTNVLSAGKPSVYSTQLLERHALSRRYQIRPEEVLAELNAGLGQPDERDRLWALCELSFAYAEKSHKQAYYLGSAAYAYAFLFPSRPDDVPDRYDARVRLAADLYNRGIALGLAAGDGKHVDLSERRLATSFASLSLAVDSDRFTYAGNHLSQFVALAGLDVRGLRNTYRRAGIGVALAARVEAADGDSASHWIVPTAKVPVTAFVRFDDPRAAMSEGELKARIEFYDVDKTPFVSIGGYSVPLESDSSAALAYWLDGSPVWDSEFLGFRMGDFSSLGISTNHNGGLFVVRPYSPHKIPVVLVHGTASSPARWAELVNELLGDPAIASRYQIWGFIYNSGNPIPLSAMRLRESLAAIRNDLDPEAKDLSLDQMVVIGHSQGGLLTKMTVVDSGSRFWDAVSAVPFEEVELKPETRDLLSRALFVKPLPFVKHVIFIATPHRGSFLASNPIAKYANKLISLPGGLVKAATEVGNVPSVFGTALTVPTALDNMSESNPFLKTLVSLPIAAGVDAHSIIAVKGTGPIEESDDGVVQYKSAHIEGVESELIVHSGHSTQGTPEAIEEVRRILYENAGIQ